MPEFIVRKEVTVQDVATIEDAAQAFFDSLGIEPDVDGTTVKVYEVGKPNPALVTVWPDYSSTEVPPKLVALLTSPTVFDQDAQP